jgi:IS5 family transposase
VYLKRRTDEDLRIGRQGNIAVTHKNGLVVGARSFPGNPYHGHILLALPKQTNILLEIIADDQRSGGQSKISGACLRQSGIGIIHHGKRKSLIKPQRRWLRLRRRQAIEPAIGHLKSDPRMDRCWPQGQSGDALHAIPCATSSCLRCLLRAMVRPGRKTLFYAPVIAGAVGLDRRKNRACLCLHRRDLRISWV